MTMFGNRNYAQLFVVVVLSMCLVLVLLHGKNISTLVERNAELDMEKAAEGNSQVAWDDVYHFVPNNVRDCAELFDGDKELPSDFNELFQEYRQDVINVAGHKVEGFTASFAHAFKAYIAMAASPFVETICETGFNAGHSTFGWLTINPAARVYSFDKGSHNYSKIMAAHIHKLHPDRFSITWGDSTQTMPDFRRENPNVKCDVMIIDGGHTFSACKSDFYNFMKMAKEENIVILDNYPQENMMTRLGDVWEAGKRRGEVAEVFNCKYDMNETDKMFGFSVGKYVVI